MSTCATHTVTEPPQTEQKPSGRRRDVDGLRAIAVGAVIIGHLWSIVHGGVDISFTISGFVITWLLTKEYQRDGKINFGKFYARRARRLLPGATLVTVATLAATWAWVSPLRWRSISLDGLFASLSCLNYRLTAQATDYFANKGASPFQHFWSLSVEEQYYALWPALLVGVAWLGKRWGKSLMTIGITLTAILVTSLTLSVIFTHSNQPIAYFGLHTRAWELAAGALVAVCVRTLSRLPQLAATLLSWGGLVVIGVSIPFITESSMPGYVVGWPVLGCAMTIAGGCASPRFGAERLLSLWPLQFIGQVSYGWYIWHWPILVLLPSVTGRDELSSLDRYGVAVGSLALAIATYYCVDKPLKSKRFGYLVLQPSKGLSMGIQLIGASVAAAAVMVYCLVPAPVKTPATTNDPLPASGIERLVAEAAQLKKLPNNVVAAIPGSPKDSAKGCIASESAVDDEGCWLGDKSKAHTKVVLFGDSHAWQWLPAFTSLVNTDDLALQYFTKVTCAPELYPYKIGTGKRTYTECATWHTNIMARIKSTRPNVVILSSGMFDGLTAESVAQLVAELQIIGARVVYLDDTPKFSFNVPECLSTHTDNAQKCAAETAKATSPKLREIRNTAATRAGATVIPTLQWFCTSKVCPPVINDTIVYNDDLHVTASYVVSLTPLLQIALNPVLHP